MAQPSGECGEVDASEYLDVHGRYAEQPRRKEEGHRDPGSSGYNNVRPFAPQRSHRKAEVAYGV
jgi:hypothetical protein